MSDASTPTGAVSNEISRAMVMLTKARTGKGPTRARTYIGDDLVVCLLREGMTQVEKTLVYEDHEGAVGAVRHLLQSSFEDEAVVTVERLMERKVASFMSTHDLHNDVAAELFVLEPLPTEDTGRPGADAAPAPGQRQEARSYMEAGSDGAPVAT
jgi:uncharacterized protein YbcI